MAGFLSSLFGKKTSKTPSAKESRDQRFEIERDLTKIGMNSSDAIDLSFQLTEEGGYGGNITFDFQSERYSNPEETTQNILKYVAPSMKERRFNDIRIWGARKHPQGSYFEPGDCFKTENIAVVDSVVSEQDFTVFCKSMSPERSDLFSFVNTPLTDMGNILASSLNKKVEWLDLDNSSLNDADLSAIAGFVKQSELKQICIADNKGHKEAFAEIIEALPATLEGINFYSMPFSDKDVDALCKKLPLLNKLESIGVADCSLTQEHLAALVKVLPENTTSFRIGENPGTTDEGLKPVLLKMQEKETMIYELGLGQEIGLSEECIDQSRNLQASNYLKYMDKTQQEKAAEISKIKTKTILQKLVQAKTGEDVKNLLHEATDFYSSEIDVLEYTFNRMKQMGATFEAGDLQKTNEKGETLVQKLSDRSALGLVMQPELYKDAKTLQAVFNTFSAEDRQDFNGENGGVSFQKVKNQLMARVVKQALSKKATQK